MNRFTVEETNLLSIYADSSKRELIENICAALPFMDGDMQELSRRTILKIDALTETEYAELTA
ncbi:MAG: transposon-transfer assisting family protein [Lachnospiraceae bacterium]